MKTARDSVTVRVPGSTSNCGAGFDTLGLAVDLHNDVTLARRPATFGAQAARPADARAQRMVDAAATAFFSVAAQAPFGFSYQIDGDVPPARGLGSSVTVRAGVIACLNALAGAGLTPHDIVGLVTTLEGHPDNAAAAVLGGFCVARSDPITGAYVDTVRFEVPKELAFVVVSPQVEILTKESRGALPATLPHADAVRAAAKSAALVHGLAHADPRLLAAGLDDVLHVPFRRALVPGYDEVTSAARQAGAYGATLSGSGPTIVAVVGVDGVRAVGGAMVRAWEARGIAAQTFAAVRPAGGFETD